MYFIAFRPRSHQEVSWFDVEMNYTPCVQVFYQCKELVHDHEGCFEREATSAKLIQVFKAGSEQLERHDSEVIAPAEPVGCRESDITLKAIVFVRFLF